jgi:hypothetical protein
MSIVVDNALEMVELFNGVATSGPLSAILLTLGALLTVVAIAIFGGLTVGGLIAPFTAGKY